MKYNSKKTNNKLIVNIITIIILLVVLIISIVLIAQKTQTTNTIESDINQPHDVVPIQAKLLTDEVTIDTSVSINATSILDSATVNQDYYKVLNPKDINAKYVLVYNKTTNQIIYQKDVDTLCYPASTTKLLTGVVALEYISPDTIFTVGDELELVPPDSSLAYIKQGQKASLKDLLYGLMLPSGNDVGYTIAVNVARIVSGNPKLENTKAIEYFAELMNVTAQKIGMNNSHFVVPDGFHDVKHYVTAKDMMKLLIYMDNFPLLKQITATYKYEVTIASGQDFVWINSNRLIDKSSEFYYEGVTTGKTGFHDDAGHCIAFTCQKNGIELYMIIMNAQTNVYRNRDALNLLNMVYNPKDIKIGAEWDLKPGETLATTESNYQTLDGSVEGF